MKGKKSVFILLFVAMLVLSNVLVMNAAGQEVTYDLKKTDSSGDAEGYTTDQATEDNADIVEVTSAKSGDDIVLTMTVVGYINTTNSTIYSNGYVFFIDIDGDNAYDWQVTSSYMGNYNGTDSQLQQDDRGAEWPELYYLDNATGIGTHTLTVKFPLAYITDIENITSWNIYGTSSSVSLSTYASYVDTAPDDEFGGTGGDGGDGDGTGNYIKFVFSGNSFELSDSATGDYDKGTFTLDTSKTPKQIDLQVTDSSNEDNIGKTALGLYDLYEPYLDMVFNSPGTAERPTSFDEGRVFYLEQTAGGTGTTELEGTWEGVDDYPDGGDGGDGDGDGMEELQKVEFTLKFNSLTQLKQTMKMYPDEESATDIRNDFDMNQDGTVTQDELDLMLSNIQNMGDDISNWTLDGKYPKSYNFSVDVEGVLGSVNSQESLAIIYIYTFEYNKPAESNTHSYASKDITDPSDEGPGEVTDDSYIKIIAPPGWSFDTTGWSQKLKDKLKSSGTIIELDGTTIREYWNETFGQLDEVKIKKGTTGGDGDGDGDGGDDKEDKGFLPGFEIIGILAGIGIALILTRKRRK